jgi:hypothetical protein
VVICNAEFDQRFVPRRFWTDLTVTCTMLWYGDEAGWWHKLGKAVSFHAP